MTDERYLKACERARNARDVLDAATQAYCYRQNERTELVRDKARAADMLAQLDANLAGLRMREDAPGAKRLRGSLIRMRALVADLADRAFGAGWNE
jgi:hypothetical protein